MLVVSHRWPALTQAFVGRRARARSAGARRARSRRTGESGASRRSRRRRGRSKPTRAPTRSSVRSRRSARSPADARPVRVFRRRGPRRPARDGRWSAGRRPDRDRDRARRARPRARRACVLVDCDDVAPSVAQRLGVARSSRTCAPRSTRSSTAAATSPLRSLELSGTAARRRGRHPEPGRLGPGAPGRGRPRDRSAGRERRDRVVDGVGSLRRLGWPAARAVRDGAGARSGGRRARRGVRRQPGGRRAAARVGGRGAAFAPATPIVVVVNRAPDVGVSPRRALRRDHFEPRTWSTSASSRPTRVSPTPRGTGSPSPAGASRERWRASEVVRDRPRRAIGVGADVRRRRGVVT